MMIGPIIFCSVVHGVAGMNDMQRVGRVALKALGYFLAITIVALVIALRGGESLAARRRHEHRRQRHRHP